VVSVKAKTKRKRYFERVARARVAVRIGPMLPRIVGFTCIFVLPLHDTEKGSFDVQKVVIKKRYDIGKMGIIESTVVLFISCVKERLLSYLVTAVDKKVYMYYLGGEKRARFCLSRLKDLTGG